MKTRIIRIGNSQGVRIPKPMLEESGLDGEVEMTVRESTIMINPVRAPRGGWSEAFRAMAAHGDDVLVDGDQIAASRWDEDEWEW